MMMPAYWDEMGRRNLRRNVVDEAPVNEHLFEDDGDDEEDVDQLEIGRRKKRIFGGFPAARVISKLIEADVKNDSDDDDDYEEEVRKRKGTNLCGNEVVDDHHENCLSHLVTSLNLPHFPLSLSPWKDPKPDSLRLLLSLPSFPSDAVAVVVVEMVVDAAVVVVVVHPAEQSWLVQKLFFLWMIGIFRGPKVGISCGEYWQRRRRQWQQRRWRRRDLLPSKSTSNQLPPSGLKMIPSSATSHWASGISRISRGSAVAVAVAAAHLPHLPRFHRRRRCATWPLAALPRGVLNREETTPRLRPGCYFRPLNRRRRRRLHSRRPIAGKPSSCNRSKC